MKQILLGEVPDTRPVISVEAFFRVRLVEILKIILTLITVVALALGIVISMLAVAKGRKMKDELGVSFKTYTALVGITEVVYIIGAAMILSAMGINTFQHLAKLEIWKFYQLTSRFDWPTVKIIGIIGWIGFVINRSISFVSPGYLLISGGRRLPRYFYYSAWIEVGLETFLTALIFMSLITG